MLFRSIWFEAQPLLLGIQLHPKASWEAEEVAQEKGLPPLRDTGGVLPLVMWAIGK